MSLKIRLTRSGAKKRPFYRIVLADSRSPRDGKFIERLGTYNPLLRPDDPSRVTLKEERIRHWLHHGARPTERVARFLGAANLIETPKQRNNPLKAQPKAKAQERAKEAQSAAAETNAAITDNETSNIAETSSSDAAEASQEIEETSAAPGNDSEDAAEATTSTDTSETKGNS